MGTSSVHVDDTATTIRGAFQTQGTRLRARAVLDVLADGEITADDGRATRALYERVAALFDGRTEQTRLQSVTGVVGALERAGWVVRDVNGRRTTRIALGPARPDDWAPPSTNGHTNGHGDQAPDHDAAEDDDVRADVGGRPGRFAARLQRELPALVADAVTAALDEDRRRVFVALGYAPPDTDAVDADALAAANDALAQLTGRVAELEHMLRDERADAHAAREELNRVIGKHERVTTSPLRAKDVHADLRDLAGHAIANGWTIRRTNGGHLAFRSPGGSQTFHSSTPGDWRAVKNFRSALEALGLPRAR